MNRKFYISTRPSNNTTMKATTIKKIALATSMLIASYFCSIPQAIKPIKIQPVITEQTQYKNYEGLENKLGAYFTTDEHETIIKSIAKENPEIASLEKIGKTWHKRPIYALKISDKNKTIEETKKKEPQILIIAHQHAKELISGTTALALAEHLTKNYNTDPKIKKYVDNNEIYIIPLANPDGLAIIEGSLKLTDLEKSEETKKHIILTEESKLWRKNVRDNNNDRVITQKHDGVDLNRNYDTGQTIWYNDIWCEGYAGPEPFSEPETKAIKNLVERLDNLVIAVDLHSYWGMIFYPPGNRKGETKDEKLFRKISEEMVKKQPYYKYGIQRKKGTDIKPEQGTFLDWVYNTHKALSFVIEIYKEGAKGFDMVCFNPPQQDIKKEVDNVLPMVFYLLEISDTIKKP